MTLVSMCDDQVVDDDYAFYDTAALATAAASNQWAGAAHWKFVGRKKKVRMMLSLSRHHGHLQESLSGRSFD